MESVEYVVLVVIAAAGLQIWLTARVSPRGLHGRQQSDLPVQVIWRAPIFGAGLVYHVLSRDAAPERNAVELECRGDHG